MLTMVVVFADSYMADISKLVIVLLFLVGCQAWHLPGPEGSRGTFASGIQVKPDVPGCVKFTNPENGKSVVVCNGTAGVPGDEGPELPPCDPCAYIRNRQPQPIQIPDASGSSVIDRILIIIDKAIYEALWLPFKFLVTLVDRAITLFMYRIVDMAILAAMAYFTNKLYKSTPFAGKGFSLA